MLDVIVAILTVIAIDISLAGDNAIVVGMAASGLPAPDRRRAIFAGTAVAALLRMVFAVFTVQLLEVVGLLLAGGLLLLWVAWKLWREIRRQAMRNACAPSATAATKTFRQAVIQIMIADLSMSLDNVLAVAGAARQHMIVLVIGLALSVILMGFAAQLGARLLQRHAWLAYVGLILVLSVALRMVWDGGHAVLRVASAAWG